MIWQSNWLLNFVNFKNSGFQSLAGFGIPWTEFRIPKLRILGFKKKKISRILEIPWIPEPGLSYMMGRIIESHYDVLFSN